MLNLARFVQFLNFCDTKHYIHMFKCFFSVPDSVASRLLIPHPILDKHKYFNVVLHEIAGDSYELMSHDTFIQYVVSQRELRWRLRQKAVQIESYEAQFSQPKDGNWQNVKKYAGDHGQLLAKDLIPAEKSLQFLESVLGKIDAFMAEIKMLKGKLFHKDMNIKPWKANELSFYEKLIKTLALLQGKFIKVKGDVHLNITMMKRRAGAGMLSSKSDQVRAKRRAKENKRKQQKRKGEREMRSCLSVLSYMLPGEKGEEIKKKVEQGDFSFRIAMAQSGPLSSKLHRAGIQFLLAKGVLTDQAKSFAGDQLQKMLDVAEARKESSAKKRKSGKQLTIQAAFEAKKDQLSDTSSESSDEDISP